MTAKKVITHFLHHFAEAITKKGRQFFFWKKG